MPGFRRLAVPLAVSAIAIAALSACVPTVSPGGKPSSAPAKTPVASQSSTPSPTPTATAAASSTPVTVPCATLITNDDIYAFNPNYGALDTWTPTPGSAAAKAQSEQGRICRWINETSSVTIDLSVAHLDPASIESLKNSAVQKSTMVPTYGDEAYFSVTNGVGTAIVFQGNYWLVMTSAAFLEPGDPADLITAALGALK